MKRLYLFSGVGFVHHLLSRDQAFKGLAQLTKELLDSARGLVHINDSTRLVTHATPHVGNFAREKNARAGAQAKPLITHAKFKFAIKNVDPLILVVMEVFWPATRAGEFENSERATCILSRYFAVIR